METPSIPPLSEDQWALYSAALAGPGREEYLDRFRRIEAGRFLGLSWNWAALLFTFAWLRYRKMYAYSWAYLLVSTPALLHLASYIRFDPCADALTGASNIANVIVPSVIAMGFVLPAIFADRIYFHFMRLKAAKPRSNEDRAVGNLWLASLGTAVIAFLVLWLTLPSHAEYTTRVKLMEVILAGSSYRTHTHAFFAKNGKLPSVIDDIGGVVGSAAKLKDVTLEQGGTIRLVAGFPPVDGRSILLTPIVRDGSIAWSCRSHDLPDQCLPANCRQ